MTTLVGTLSGSLILQTRAFVQPLKEAEGELDRLEVKAQRAGSSLRTLGNRLNSAGDSFVRFGTRASVAFAAPIAALGGFALKTAAWFEQTDVAMQTFMGSASQASQYVKDLTQFSASTPFQVRDWLQGSRLLLAYGFQAKQLIPTLRVLGDTTASFGVEPERLQSIIRALGEMKAFGRVYGRQLLMLAMQGVPIYNILQEKLGLTSKQIHEIGVQGLDSSKVIPLILQGLQETFGGQMQRQMQTFNGLWSNLMDNVTITANTFGQDWLPTAERVVKQLVKITQYLRNLSGEQRMQILRWAAIAAAIPPVIIGLGLLIKMAATTATVLSFLGGAIDLAFSPVMLIIVAIIAAIGLFATAWDKNWGDIRGKAAAFKTWFTQDFLPPIQAFFDHPLNTAWTWAVTAAGNMWDWLQNTGVYKAVKTAWTWTVDAVGGAWQWVKDKAGWIGQTAQTTWDWTISAAGNAWSWISAKAAFISDWIAGAAKTSWDWAVSGAGNAWEWLTHTPLVQWIDSTAKSTWDWVVNIAKWLGDMLNGITPEWVSKGINTAWTFTIKWAGQAVDAIRSLGEKANNVLDSGTVALLKAIGVLPGDYQKGGTLGSLLDSVHKAEGNSNYGVVAGQGVAGTNFYPSKLPAGLQASFQSATSALQPKSEAWYRAVANYAILAYWDTFTTKFPQYAGKAFDEVGPQVQAQFIRYFGKSWAPIGASNDPTGLNKNWIPNVLRFMGLQGYATGGMLPGRGGPDQFLAMLAPGEAVVPAGVVNRGSPAVINWFRGMGVPGFADGGIPGGTAGMSLGSTNVGQMNSFVAGLQTAVHQIGTVLLKGFVTIMNVLITVVEAIGKAILGDQKWEKVSGAIKDARKQLQDFVDMLEGKGPRGIPTPNTTATVAGMTPGPSFWQKLGEAMGPALNTGMAALQQAQPLAANTVSAFVGGSAEGGPLAGLANAGMTLLTSSKTFQQIMAVLTPLFQALADAVGSLLQPILPLVNLISTILAPVLKAFGVIISSLLLPIMPILFIGLKMLGLAVLALAIGIGAVWNAIATAINWALGWLGVHLNLVNIGDLAKKFSDLANMTYKDSQALGDHKKAVDAVTASLKNVPEGFKTALRTFQSAKGYSVPHMASGGVVTRPTVALIGEAGPEAVVPLNRSGMGGNTIHVQIVSNDPDTIWKKLEPLIERKNFQRHGTTLTPAPRFLGGSA